MQTIFITGSNRGLGLAFVKQYLANGDEVYATCRKPEQAEELLQLKSTYPEQLELILLDVTNEKHIHAVKMSLENKAIDILINNAGIYGPQGMDIENIKALPWQTVLTTNTIAPIMITQALLENIKQSKVKKCVYISSRMGSITDNAIGGRYIYRSSKAALNTAVRSMAIDVKEDKIICLLLHPGWVQTNMGGKEAELTPEESTTRLKKIIDNATLVENGKFFSHDGRELPW